MSQSLQIGRFELRPYQREAIDRVVSARRKGVRRMVVCLPTGSGKTVIFAELARMAHRPVLVLAHRQELLQQAVAKLARALGGASVIAIEQGTRAADANAHVVVASIRSLHEARLTRLLAKRRFGLVVYDECHHAPAEDNKRVLRALGAFDDDWEGTLLGFTATTIRGDGAGLDGVFETIVYRRSISEMVADGYLAPLRGYRIATAADLVAVSARSGDFAIEELAEAVDIESRNALVARSVQELARDRRTIAFCVTVNHARRLARSLNAIGLPTGIVYGQQKTEVRQKTLADFRAGRLSAVTNVGVLTEGFDDPGVSCVAMARPTRSSGLYAQCVGRGTRLAPGKTDCLVLDFVDLSALSLVTLPTLAGLPRGLDLEGKSLDEAERAFVQIWDENPGFEVEPGSITLGEIQRRAASFDPLDLGLDIEVRAVSPNCWDSLGSRGLVLSTYWSASAARKGRLSQVLVLDLMRQTAKGNVRSGGRRWQVTLDGREMERFTRIEDAVQAVDYEVHKRGRVCAVSASPDATWRHEPMSEQTRQKLLKLTPPQRAETEGDALRLLAFAAFGPKWRPKRY